MKTILLIFVFLFNIPAHASSEIVGHWLFFQKIYQGVVYPEPPEAVLRLHFTFTEAGESHLLWWREGDSRICERKGLYHVDGDILEDRIVWVNPKNGSDCSQDPDMQLGKITRTQISFVEGNFHLHIPLGNEKLIYVWKKI